MKRLLLFLALCLPAIAQTIPPSVGVYSLVGGSGSGGGGTVTSVSFTGGLISVADPTGAAALTVAGTSGGIPYFSSTSTWASSGLLADNVVILGGGAGAAPTGSLLTDNGTTLTYTGTGGIAVTSSVAGAISLFEGTAPAGAAANSVQIHAPTDVTTAYDLITPAASSTGLVLGTDSTNVNTLSFLAPGTSGNVATSNGTTWVSSAAAASALTATYVGYGSAGNVLTGEAAFTYDATLDTLTVGGSVLASGAVRAGQGENINWNNRTVLNAPANGAFRFQTNGGATGYIVGTITNDSPTAGGVGETISSAIAVGSVVSLTTDTTANVTSISLTAGDWDVSGNVNYTAAAATVTATSGGVTSTSATIPTDGTEVYNGTLLTIGTSIYTATAPTKRFSLAGTTTVYLVARSTFSAGTVGAFGSIVARRRR